MRDKAELTMTAQRVEGLIHVVRGQRVMLDVDLARLYEVTVGALNQAVKRNPARFPDDFAFQLAPQEVAILKSQIVISSWGGRRSAPWVFTEQGIAMLSSVKTITEVLRQMMAEPPKPRKMGFHTVRSRSDKSE